MDAEVSASMVATLHNVALLIAKVEGVGVTVCLQCPGKAFIGRDA